MEKQPYEHSNPLTRINRRNKKNLANNREEFIKSELAKFDINKVFLEVEKNSKYSATYSLYSENSEYKLENSLKEPSITLQEEQECCTYYIHPEFDLTVELRWVIQNSIPKVYYRIIGHYLDVKFNYANNKRFEGIFNWNESYQLVINTRGVTVKMLICFRKYN